MENSRYYKEQRMKLIKFKEKKKYNYKRKVFVKDLVLKTFVGIHSFEKKKKQRVRFNLDITLEPNLFFNSNDMTNIVNYETVIKNIENISKKKHYLLLENLAEEIFLKLFREKKIKKINLRIEKLDIIKNTSSVGIEVEKSRLNEH
tara:strand:- start:150 stop:587 length:438 start_codon:yes stop_codon:yes gene_type:complete